MLGGQHGVLRGLVAIHNVITIDCVAIHDVIYKFIMNDPGIMTLRVTGSTKYFQNLTWDSRRYGLWHGNLFGTNSDGKIPTISKFLLF